MATPAEHLVTGERRMPLSLLVPGDNPRRKKPDPAYVLEMAESMRKHDVIEPLIVRAKGDKFQIVCGGTRFEAAGLAGLVDVPIVLRTYTDLDVLEVQLIENIARNSMHPIDEGEAFKRLIDTKKHTVESLAKTVGKSIRWIYNRLEFTKLIPPLRDAFLNDEITVSHAELIARLEPIDQKRIDNAHDTRGRFRGDDDGLWRWDVLDLDGDGKREKPQRAVRSLRDVDSWIETNVRLAIHTPAVQNLLPEVEDVQMEAAREQSRVLQVATVFLLPQDPNLKKRFAGVLTDRHWKRAGGKSRCEFAEKGVIVFGDGQGEVLDVCVNKKQCKKHWPEHQPAAKARRSKTTKGTVKSAEVYQAQLAREQAERTRLEARWKKLCPALHEATFAAAKKLGGKVPPALLADVLYHHELPNAKPADLPRILLVDSLRAAFDRAEHWYGNEKMVLVWTKRLGVNVKAIEKELLTPEKPAAERGITSAHLAASKTVTKKKPAKRKAGKKR